MNTETQTIFFGRTCQPEQFPDLEKNLLGATNANEFAGYEPLTLRVVVILVRDATLPLFSLRIEVHHNATGWQSARIESPKAVEFTEELLGVPLTAREAKQWDFLPH